MSADRDVLNWRRSRTTSPTVEDFEAKKGYIEQQKQFNQDAIVNGLGNGTLKVGSDEWYALQKKGDKLQEQIDAYNRGMMGVLDGEKAVTRSEQETSSTTRSGGGQMGDMSLSANNDEPMYVGMNDEAASRKKDENNEEPVSIYTKGNSLRDSKSVQLLKENLDTTYYKILGMSVSEREAFASTNSAKNYFGNIEVLKNILAPEELSRYKRVLYGNDDPYEVTKEGYVIVKTAPDYSDGEISYENRNVDLLTTQVDDTYYEIKGMSEFGKREFASTQQAKNYFENIELLKFVLTPEEALRYKQVLYGTIDPYEVTEHGLIVKTVTDESYGEGSRTQEEIEMDQAEHLKGELSEFYSLAINMSTEEFETNFPNGIEGITIMELELQHLIGNEEYQKFMSSITQHKPKEWTPDEFFEELYNLESQVETEQALVNGLNNTLTYDTSLFEDESIVMNLIEQSEEHISSLNEQITNLRDEYIEQNTDKDYIAVSDKISVDFTGEQDIIDKIRETSVYQEVVSSLNQLSAYGIGSTELDIHVVQDSMDLLDNEAAYKIYKEMCDNKDLENKVILGILSTGLSAVTLGADKIVGAAVLAGTAILNLTIDTSPEDVNFNGLLAGEYTVSSFVLDGDFDLPGNGKRFLYSGVVIHGEPIILENGDVIDNPINTIIIVPEKIS